MKVLLISPLDPEKPINLRFLMGGENTYTRNLLDNPPKGVEYLYFEDALKQGKIKYSFWQYPLNLFIKLRILPLGPRIYSFEVKDKFDLIHSHGHALKISGSKIPVVLSDSSSNILFLRDYLKWGRVAINLRYFFKNILFQTLNIYDQELNLKEAILVVWSEFAKKIHSKWVLNKDKIIVIPPGISDPYLGNIKLNSQFNILFIGVWFKRKGGDLLLAAYKVLKKKYPKIKLTLVGEVPKKIKLPKDTNHQNFFPRKELIKNIFPKASVLVLVPPVAEGYGVVVEEAAAFGIPVIVTSIYALPELVEDNKTGFVIPPGGLKQLVKSLEKLITNHKLRKKLSLAARERFLKKYWIKKTNPQLIKAYQQVIKSFSASK